MDQAVKLNELVILFDVLTTQADKVSLDTTEDISNITNSFKQNNYKKYNIIDTCFTCGSTNLSTDRTQGCIACIDCGQVLGTTYDTSVSWNQDDNGNSTICGIPINPLLPQSSLGTRVPSKCSARLKVLHCWNQMPYKERSQNKEFKRIADACRRGNLLKCIEDDAKILYKISSECRYSDGANKGKYKITRGINRLSIIAACIFFACVRKGIVRTTKEIASLYDISVLDLNRGCKHLNKLLLEAGVKLNMSYVKPEHFIVEHCNNLNMRKEYQDTAYKIAANIDKLNMLYNHTAYSMAAVSILLAVELHKLNITRTMIAQEFRISETTMVKVYTKIRPYMNILLDDVLVAKIENIYNNMVSELSDEILERMRMFGVTKEDIGRPYSQFKAKKEKSIISKTQKHESMTIENYNPEITMGIINDIGNGNQNYNSLVVYNST